MATIREADFYYGSVLSMLLSKGIKPVLIEGDDDRQIFDFTTNHSTGRLFVKYRTDRQSTITPDYNSWGFNLSQTDIGELSQFINDGMNIVLALVCGSSSLSESELALLDSNDVKEILEKEKASISISRKKGERKYRISVGGGRANAKTIRCNRFQELFL